MPNDAHEEGDKLLEMATLHRKLVVAGGQVGMRVADITRARVPYPSVVQLQVIDDDHEVAKHLCQEAKHLHSGVGQSAARPSTRGAGNARRRLMQAGTARQMRTRR